MRRRTAVAVIIALAGGLARAEDDASTRVAVRVSTERTTRYVGEPIDVRLEVDFDEPWLKEHGVPMFLRPMDVPVRVECPGLPAGTAAAAAADDAAPHATFALHDGVVEGRSLAGAPGRTLLVVDRTALAAEPGDLVIGPPRLTFAYATRFSDDLVNGRVALDRKDATVAGDAITIHVAALPEEGRPPGFDGAIGRFDVKASVDATSVEVGRLFHLTLRIAADGPSSIPTTPRLDSLAGLHVFGAKDDAGSPRRTIVYDVAVTDAGLRELPAIAFASFDPEPPATYRVARTSPIALDVRASAGPASAPPSASDAPGRAAGGLPGGAVVWIGGTGVLLGLALGLGWARRARRAKARAVVEMASAAVVAAAARYHERVARSKHDAADAFAEFLAARMGRPLAWVISPDLQARLLEAGVEVSLATRAARAMEALVAARYGGGEPDLEEAAAIVDVFDVGLNAR